MPRLKQKPKAHKDLLLESYIKGKMPLYGYSSLEKLAVKVHINARTLRYKVKDPDKFTRHELSTIFDILEFTPEEKCSVM